MTRRPERGAAAVLAVVMVGVLVAVGVLVTALGGAVADQRRVESAADLAALAAASAVQAGQDACAAARRSATRNGGRLVRCTVADKVVTVRVQRWSRAVPGHRLDLIGHASAGPVPP